MEARSAFAFSAGVMAEGVTVTAPAVYEPAPQNEPAAGDGLNEENLFQEIGKIIVEKLPEPK